MKKLFQQSISILFFFSFITSYSLSQTAEKPNGSGTESDPYERANQRLHKDYPEILNNSTSQYFTARTNHRGQWYLYSYISQQWDGIQWVNYFQTAFTYDTNDNRINDLTQSWDGAVDIMKRF